MRRLLTVAVWALFSLLLSAASSWAAPAGPALLAGLMRYALDTNRPWLALVYAPARPSGEALFLRGEAYRRLGMNGRARADLLKAAGAGNTAEAAGAQMSLGFIDADAGRLDSAGQHLRKAVGDLGGEQLQHASFELAELDRQQGNLDLAAQRLSSMANGIWAAYGYLDLATAYASLDSDPSRTLVSLRVAAAMIDGDKTAQADDLRDRINLTAAYVAFRAGQYGKTLDFLNKIRLSGYYAPSALYLHGLAQARQDNYRGAMQFWHRARKFPLAFPGVPEASMGMGLAFDETGYLGEAGDAYLGASSAFEKELVNLQALARQVRKKGAWRALMVASRNDNVEWFLADSKSLTTPRMAYLSRLMESGKAQHAAMRVSRLHQLDRQLDRESRELKVFEQMLEGRLNKVRKNRNSGALRQLRQRSDVLKKQRKSLQARLSRAKDGDDMAALVSGPLGKQFARLKSLEDQAASGRPAPQLKARLARIRGILIWRAQEQEARNARSLSAALHQASVQLDRVDAAISSFDRKLAAAPDRFAGLLERVRKQSDRVAAARKTLSGLIRRAGAKFDRIALAFFSGQENRMRAWRDRSNQEVAHLYEYLALTQEQRQDARGKTDKGQGDGQ